MNVNELFSEGINRKLIFFSRAADMVSISLAATEQCPYEFAIQVTAPAEIIFQGKRLTCTEEMYDSDGTQLNSTYDAKIAALMQGGQEFFLRRLYADERCCLHAVFSNCLEVHSLPLPSKLMDDKEEYNDLWWVFLNWCAEITAIGYPTGIEVLPPEMTQAELDRKKANSHRTRKPIG